MSEKYIVVVGGLNLDIAGLSGPIYREFDSNIGDITTNAGGVGHNIAQNLTSLEVPTYLVTVYGDDHFGDILVNECQKANISLEYAEQLAGKKSSTYLYVTDNNGDMVTAINDMKIVDEITPDFLADKLDFINGATLCVIDGNISKASIDWLAAHVTVPIFVDPVSVAKADRFLDALDKIDTIKPNEYEAELFTGIKVVDEETAKQAAQAMLDKGIENVYISLGAKGMLAATGDKAVLVEPMVDKIVSTNGAGDCTMATLAWARFQYGGVLDVEEACQFAQAAASITIESNQAVSPDLNVRDVVRRAVENYGG
ncbi:pseudouridine kinase [Aerococcus urinaehominis]|nr:carbohydrate kinase family protein [Aerococcus urinaehominis]SDM52221.1 pseudouridine kinase [Aerococcus urinaehominis]